MQNVARAHAIPFPLIASGSICASGAQKFLRGLTALSRLQRGGVDEFMA